MSFGSVEVFKKRIKNKTKAAKDHSLLLIYPSSFSFLFCVSKLREGTDTNHTLNNFLSNTDASHARVGALFWPRGDGACQAVDAGQRTSRVGQIQGRLAKSMDTEWRGGLCGGVVLASSAHRRRQPLRSDTKKNISSDFWLVHP